MNSKNKKLVLLLSFVLIFNFTSCELFDDLDIPDLSGSSSSGSSATGAVTTSNTGHPDYLYEIRSYEDYKKAIQEIDIPDGFISYEMISGLGNFDSFVPTLMASDKYEMPEKIGEFYGYSLGEHRFLVICHEDNSFSSDGYSSNYYIYLSEENKEDDLRYCAYTQDYAIYRRDNITYTYFRGKLERIAWKYNGISYLLFDIGDEDYRNNLNFANSFDTWRKWDSLFINKQTTGRAIEFFGMMLDGELPTIEEVFGDTTEPCEITWKKPE